MNIKTIDDMKKLDWREFEKFIEFIFKKKWYKAKTRKWRNDWWIDLDATYNWQKYVIQCKKWDKYKIWVVQLREFYWVVKMSWENTKWIYITTSSLTKEALKEYETIKNDVELWDSSNLEAYIAEYKWIKTESEEKKENTNNITEITKVEKKEDTKTIKCERCWWSMILREAHKWEHKWEKFYWCENFPKCRYIIKIEN
jgi:restriction system protein